MPRSFVVGDIHGCYDELIELVQKLNLQEEDILISVGDIVDRGNKSREVYEFFRDRPNSFVIVGNHEKKHVKGILNYSQEIVKLQFGEQYEEFLEWIQQLPYFYETEKAIIVHAAFEHDKPLQEQKKGVLCGSSSGERYLEKKYPEKKNWCDYYKGRKTVFYGHRVTGDSPRIKNNTYGIDTGASHGGYLTAIDLDIFAIHQVKVKKDYWKKEQEKWQLPVLKAKNWNYMTFETIQKQLEKLAYLEDKEVKLFLKEREVWKENLLQLYPQVKKSIDSLTCKLLKEETDFPQKANQYFFKSLLFKSRDNNLRIEDIKRLYDTPEKLMSLVLCPDLN